MTCSARKTDSFQSSPRRVRTVTWLLQGIDDPVFEQAVSQVLLALGFVIALDAAGETTSAARAGTLRPRQSFGAPRRTTPRSGLRPEIIRGIQKRNSLPPP